MKTLKIVILGAQGSGKSWLANALLAHEKRLTVVESSLPLDIQTFDLIFLMGLDFCHLALQQEQDGTLRASLKLAQAAYQVVYGYGELRKIGAISAVHLKNATVNIANNAIFHGEPDDQFLKDSMSTRWQWQCEKCSDADCEHRLFTALKKQSMGEPSQ